MSARSSSALRGLFLILFGVVALLLLRSGQLLGVGPLLFDWEFVQFGSLALEVEAGTRHLSEIWRRPDAWTYMEHAQGTMLPIAGTALLVPWFGASIWVLHATSVVPEALALGLLLMLLWRRSGSPTLILAATFAWVCVPRGAAVWQMLPFGNHTEFLWVPLAVALLLDLRPRSAVSSGLISGAMVLLLGLGFVAYRGTLATAVALLAALVLSRRSTGGLRRALAIGVASSCLSLWALHGLTDPEQWRGLGTLRELLLGAPVMDPSLWADRVGRLPQRLPSGPAALGSPWPYLLLLVAGAFAVAGQLLRGAVPSPPPSGMAATEESGRPIALLFLGLWMLVSVGMTLAADARYDQYFLQPFYGLLALGLVAPSTAGRGSLLRRWSLLGVVGLGLLGAPDAGELLRPAAWEANRSYQGLALWGQFEMTSLDEDDIPYWDRLAGTPHLRHFVGQGFPPNERCGSNLRVGGKLPLPDPGSNRCSCWEEGALATFVAQRLREDPAVPIEQLGLGAWIGCNRDEGTFSAALVGLSPPLLARVWAGTKLLD